MAWPEKRPSGWYIRWREPDGRKPAAGPYGSKALAVAAAEEFDARTAPKRRRRAGARPVEPLTINQLAALWKQANEGDATRMARPGAAEYLATAVALVAKAQGAALPGDLTPASAAALRKRLPRTASILRGILRWARDHHGTPLDPIVYASLRPQQSRRADLDLLTDRQARYVLARARRFRQLPLFSCLMLYGWRPVTACRLTVGDFDAKRGTIRLAVKHSGEPWQHPLFPFHVDMLRELAAGRPADAPLFLTPRGKPWTISKTGGANTVAVWYRRNLAPRGAKVGNVYACKRLAISRMLSGAWPWPAPLQPVDVRLFTAQRSDAIVVRYLASHDDRARKLVQGAQRAEGAKAYRILPLGADVPRGPV